MCEHKLGRMFLQRQVFGLSKQHAKKGNRARLHSSLTQLTRQEILGVLEMR